MPEEIKYLNLLNISSPPLDLNKIKQIINYFGSIKNFWEKAKNSEIKQIFSKNLSQKIIKNREILDPDQEFKKLEKENIKTISIFDKNYPFLLKQITFPPPLIYLKGEIRKDEFCIGVVGTRKPTNYGKEACQFFVKELIKQKVCIVSGLALGIDSIAHKSALSQNGRTIAVLGSAINEKSIYPKINLSLVKEILKNNGAIISEYPYGTKPQKYFFPLRNRIISGLSKGILIVEAPIKSGALITANWALEQNREVFSIPGSIFSKNSEGTNSLIKIGAKLVSKPLEILEELNFNIKSEKEEKNLEELKLSKEEKLIIRFLSKEPLHINEIIKKSPFDAQKINSLLLLLELKDLIKNLGNGMYKINLK